MRIDSHMHFGTTNVFPQMPLKVIEKNMKNYDIDMGIVSTTNGLEYGHDLNVFKLSEGQLKSNKYLFDLTKDKDNIKLLFWCRPNREELNEKLYNDIYNLIDGNRDKFIGFKFHPYHSNLPVDDKRYEPYLKLAKELKIPISIHSANHKTCTPKMIYELAKRNPEINFIMVHLGLATDNEEGIKYVSMLDNLYGDTTWVPHQKILKAINVCGSEKILFGSDAPIDLDKTYKFYKDLFSKKDISDADYENIMCKNAKKLFRI